MRSFLAVSICALSLVVALGPGAIAQPTAGPLPASHVDTTEGHPRLFVLSDIGNEPDDQMSLVRLLVYSNEIDIEGLVATTSTWQKTATHPETMHALVDAYGEVRTNLLLHASGWPEAARLHAVIASGQGAYGMAAVGPDKVSDGARLLVAAADRNDPRPLWVGLWGGANTLAQALVQVRASRTPAQVDAFVARLRVSSISDQDDAGPWIRKEFPKLFYVVKPSPPNGEEYGYATWTGISGDRYYRNGAGADFATVTNEWLDTNIRAKGPLGKHYPRYMFIMEGDTPSFLGLTNNGLNSHRNPNWGGWGGRYVYRAPYGEGHAIWTQGGDAFARATSQDEVAAADGKTYTSDQATIWRWREAFQHDFAARMDWSVKPYAQANHNPVLVVNGQKGTAPVVIDAKVGQAITLDAAQSTDPDGHHLRFSWLHYPEAASGIGLGQAQVRIDKTDGPLATVTPTSACRSAGRGPCRGAGVAHVVLVVTDDGSPSLTSYRRVIVNVAGQ